MNALAMPKEPSRKTPVQSTTSNVARSIPAPSNSTERPQRLPDSQQCLELVTWDFQTIHPYTYDGIDE